MGDGVSHPTEIVELAPGSVGTREPTGVPAGLDIGDDPDERRKLRVVDLRQLEIRLPGLPMSILDVVDDVVVDRDSLRPVGGVRLDESPESLLEQRDAIEEMDRRMGRPLDPRGRRSRSAFGPRRRGRRRSRSFGATVVSSKRPSRPTESRDSPSRDPVPCSGSAVGTSTTSHEARRRDPSGQEISESNLYYTIDAHSV